MGNTLNIAGQWTSVDDSRGILQVTSLNKVILDKISKFILRFPIDHPKEAAMMFYQPMVWISTVEPSTITSYLIKKSEYLYFSEQEDESKRPWLSVRISKDEKTAEVKAYNFEALAFVLRISEGFELSETKICLESNSDPLICMLGPQFSEKYQSLESPITNYLENALCTLQNNDLNEVKETYEFLTFAMILKEFDVYLMKETLKFMGSIIKLTPKEVENHFNSLIEIIQKTPESTLLKSIDWMSPFTFVFENGCRAPLWRQLYGDIAYIVAATIDNRNIFITASTGGYYVNKREGFLNNSDVDFQRNGEYFPNLIFLLKNSCPHFRDNIDKVLSESKVEERTLKISMQDLKKKKKSMSAQKVISLMETDKSLVQDNKCLVEGESAVLSLKVATDTSKDVDPTQNLVAEKKIKKKIKYCKDRTSLYNHELENWIKEYSSEESDPETDSDRDGPPEKTIYNYNVKPRDPKFAGYWHIQNMFQFIKTGGHPPTLIGLCSILDMDLSQENVAMSIVEANGVEVLVNILEVNDFECQIASLKILIEISKYRPIWQCIINFGGIEILIELLHNTNITIRCLAAECLGSVAKTAKARQLIRDKNGLFKLVGFLDTFVSKMDYILGNGHKFYPSLPLKQLAKLEEGPIVEFLNKQWQRSMELAKSGAIVISALSNSKRARKAMQLYNVLPYLSRHLKSSDSTFLRSIVKIIAEFAKESQYRSSILSENMIPYLVRELSRNDNILTQRICTVFYRACDDERIRNEVRKQNGLISMVKILEKNINGDYNSLPVLKAITGAISKLCLSPDNVKVFSKLGIIQIFIPLMKSGSIKVLLHVLASFREILKVPANRIEFDKNKGLPILLTLQSNTIPQVLILVNYALAQCAEEKSLINTIIENDGVRLLWSLLIHPSDEVKASAAWAIAPCIQTAQDSGYMVRSLVGGLEMLVKLLKSSNINVLAAVCATIANVVQDEENLGILTEFKVCYLLSKILCAQHCDGINRLKATLAEAIAQCCRFGNNRITFGNEDVIVHLVKYLDTDDVRIQRATSQALYQLSLDPNNIIRMHAECCVKPLLKLIGSADVAIQEASSKCVSNIRNLAFANNKLHNKLPEEL